MLQKNLLAVLTPENNGWRSGGHVTRLKIPLDKFKHTFQTVV